MSDLSLKIKCRNILTEKTMQNQIVQCKTSKNFYCNISRMEESKSYYICVECPSNFSFHNFQDFEFHNCTKKSNIYFECIYCGLLVLWKNGERHVHKHFKCNNYSIYNCSSCLFTSNSQQKFLRHLFTHDKNNLLNLTCVGCEDHFKYVDEFIKHVNFHTIIIYNCCIANCLIRTNNKSQMCNHIKMFHPTKSASFEITFFLSCSERTPDVIYTNQLSRKIPSLESKISLGKFNSVTNHKSAIVYLECFKCNFSTLTWQTFIRHYFKCVFDKENDEDHYIYICSSCFSISTKKHLITEHLLECDKIAKVLVESLPIRSTQKSSGVLEKGNEYKSCKRSISLCSEDNEVRESKKRRITESSESKGKTEEAVISDYEEDSSTEVVSIPFDEEVFRSNNVNLPYHQKESLINKMRQFSQCQINIVGKENYGRIPECPECHKVFSYGFGDFKRHFMLVHLEIEKEHIKECLKFTKLPKTGDKFQEIQEQLLMRNLRPKAIDKDRIKVPLPYAIGALKKLTEFLPLSTQQYLSEKMKAYSIMSILIQNVENSRRFLCNQCSYSSPYALADVRKHIMGSHCGISTKHFRYCLQASRLDPNEFTLLPDDKILNLAKDLSRRSKQKSLTTLTSLSVNNAVNLTLTSHNTRFQKWSKGSKKSHAISQIKSENVLTPVMRNHSLGGRKGINALFLNADSTYDLALPMSEKVLYVLLQVILPEEQVNGIVQKMKVYANYSLKRLCKNERTVAFQCPCGRVFHTSRIPDLKMRAATLADARRHVMGVHAKIPQALITVCCQASRICRENDFQIYSDEMLLQLASERQGKLPDVQSRSYICGDSSSKSQECLEEIFAERTDQNSVKNYDMFSSLHMNSDETFSSVLEDNIQKTNSFLSSSFKDEEAYPSSDLPKEELLSLNVEESQFSLVTEENATLRLDTESCKVERIIQLPYSLGALKCLTDGYCEPLFFPVLEDKMNIYSRYRIYIIRREGRRIFCCSGCPSSSPHGMGDVKKHILGVHARIPERFKAAAMHCSRLSREDTSLLPDHLLLQLAKMKWKGSVIKPLAELTTEDRLKSISKKSGDGKPKNWMKSDYCSMVKQPTISTNINIEHKDSLSVLPSKMSAAISEVSSVIEDVNDDSIISSGSSDIIVPEDFFVEILQRQSEVAYRCSMCDYESRFIGNTKGHIVREHLGIPANTCSICEQLFNSRVNVLSHHEQDHKGLPFILAHYGPYKVAISKIITKEFHLSQSETLKDNIKIKKVIECKRNSFLQNGQDPSDYEEYFS